MFLSARNAKVAGSNPAPSNQLHSDQEVAGCWRPLAVSGRTQHSCQVALQRDPQLVALRFEQDGLDERTNGLHGARAALLVLGSGMAVPVQFLSSSNWAPGSPHLAIVRSS